MTDESIGYLLVRYELVAVTESESWEIPQEYTYLAINPGEVIERAIPEGWREQLSQDISEFDYTLNDAAASMLLRPEVATSSQPGAECRTATTEKYQPYETQGESK